MAQTVSIKEVARLADVSVGTVSNVLNRPEKVAEGTRIRVQRIIEQTGFVRSESARQLRAGSSRMLAMLVLDMANPFFVSVAKGAERAARDAGLGVMLPQYATTLAARGRALPWPPARSAGCWCGSGRPYRGCHGG
ncbi:LacI family DNA-binding transcriptional regulator [Streptomyces sp. t39]|nr:LacI family DNA-binding transcriptional regulator [Streptomyces sp. t39]